MRFGTSNGSWFYRVIRLRKRGLSWPRGGWSWRTLRRLIQGQRRVRDESRGPDEVGGVFVISSVSAYAKFMECPELYRFHYLVKARPTFDGVPLGVGTAVHGVLERYYREVMFAQRGIKEDVGSVEDVVDRYEKLGVQCESVNEKTRYLQGLATIKSVADIYPKWASAIDNFEVLEVEGGVTNQEMGKWDGRMLRVDMLVKQGGRKYVFEIKTTAASQVKPLLTVADMRLQTLTYVAATGADGIIYQLVKKPTIRQKKSETIRDYCARVRDEYQLDPAKFLERHRFLVNKDQAEAEARRRFNGADVMLAALKASTPDAFPKNDGACMKWGKPCPYLPCCKDGVNVRDMYEVKE